ncbi:hypothetical protein [Desulfovibrio litoralis]|uniref:Anti-bacteriophage protein A/HamA C-terminal domain-containing protein n=1 Tax=Desulfovibrio litoralis DSM 11393 TaxID=1121455 RepID=A0A1M7TH78_9BACT|nr:hypothetical protein [Desulfovibrio litoralis]SHN70041.1 hypothetical protein SAMN02745728_01991 [Desulfovibrio litoralis DSM 11393]
MDILESYTVKNVDYCYTDDTVIYCARVKVSNVSAYAKEMIDAISNTSWLNPLEIVSKRTFAATAQPTINKLVSDILGKVENTVTEEFGEYMVSNSALKALEKSWGHKPLPLAELLKEKILGNPGFDFHTESHTGYISFGEAKYSSSVNPYSNALTQIIEFIDNKKDEMEFGIVKNFVSSKAMNNALDGAKGYIAAFSINAVSPNTIMQNAVSSKHTKQLTCHKEIYLIGVEVS